MSPATQWSHGAGFGAGVRERVPAGGCLADLAAIDGQPAAGQDWAVINHRARGIASHANAVDVLLWQTERTGQLCLRGLQLCARRGQIYRASKERGARSGRQSSTYLQNHSRRSRAGFARPRQASATARTTAAAPNGAWHSHLLRAADRRGRPQQMARRAPSQMMPPPAKMSFVSTRRRAWGLAAARASGAPSWHLCVWKEAASVVFLHLFLPCPPSRRPSSKLRMPTSL